MSRPKRGRMNRRVQSELAGEWAKRMYVVLAAGRGPWRTETLVELAAGHPPRNAFERATAVEALARLQRMRGVRMGPRPPHADGEEVA
jgi:hypothetical protein